ncbi:MAG: hypothetical protein AAF988_00915 [Pseudomonadota bacterium]
MFISGEVTNPQRKSGIEPYTAVGPEPATLSERIKREAWHLPGTTDVNAWFEERVLPEFRGNFSKAVDTLYEAISGKDADDDLSLEDKRLAMEAYNPVLGQLDLTV